MTHELSNLQFWDNFFKFGFVTSFAIPNTNYNFKFPNLQLSICCESSKFTKLLVWPILQDSRFGTNSNYSSIRKVTDLAEFTTQIAALSVR